MNTASSRRTTIRARSISTIYGLKSMMAQRSKRISLLAVRRAVCSRGRVQQVTIPKRIAYIRSTVHEHKTGPNILRGTVPRWKD